MARQAIASLDNSYTSLHALSPTASLPQIQKSHAQILKTGLCNDTHLATKLISLYASRFQFSDASCLLNSVAAPDSFSFSALISAFSKSNLFHKALRLFERMVSLNLPCDNFVSPSALKACAGLSALQVGRQIHNLVSVSGFGSDPFVQSSLAHMYVKCGEMSEARKMFDRMGQRNVVSWSAMVSGYAREGYIGEAMELFEKMRDSGVEPNLVSWNGLIAGFNQSGHSAEAVSILKEMHTQGFKPDGTTISSVLPSVGDLSDLVTGLQIHDCVIKNGSAADACVVSALVDMYGKCRSTKNMMQVFDEMVEMDVASCNALVTGLSRNGLVEDALRVFKQLKRQQIELNVVSWTSMVACCAQNGKDIEALELFREMQTVGIKPNSVTVPCLLPACANIAALTYGKAIHCYSLRQGIFEDVYVSSALVDMYAKCGKIWGARVVFNAIPLKNVVSWNAIIGGYSMHGKAKEAIHMFNLMQESGQKPDRISFTCVLSACSQSGLIKEGRGYFHSMFHEHGITVRMEHYACMVNLLGRVGRLEDAYKMITQMPAEPDACVWGALLSSCRIHGNTILGETAAEELFRLEPRNAGNYVLLSNIYASKRMWDGVNRVRERMKHIGLKKDPGCSWIELKNKVHTLLAGDKSHPQMTQILERLKRLSLEMHKSGYFPDTHFVLQDVEEQEKEHILCGHSEKLAVGLALLNTPPGFPLRVIKNLRICGDCHNTIKFISKFEGREIFVRDTNRFHHFKDGVCSCEDFW
ncbi:pentatricopeptide repeat-containing protein At1g20230 [Aristolochia californica]|uniref:pentatricopeptide repeat-containing protein At1g20230 n=1 Tax=Aristolochia californica TaxID=171875 RepID=UPI0035DA22CB